uniref:VP1 n=1 Tax=Tarsiger cyanurus densovirus TaxID=2794546 RepID=A0A8A4XE03_9VIRU|nr:MAG: VP1 [Tarsiger cyanurus densovirus]
MLKRKNETGEEGPEKKIAPIPRHLPQQSITLNFVCRSWETLAPGELLYLPLCQTPKYMMDDMSRACFNQFAASMWGTLEIHNPSFRIANIIFLQDDLRVQSSTPTDATAFTQVCYLIQYSPTRNAEYFKLQAMQDYDQVFTGRDLTYQLQPAKGGSKMTKVGELNYEQFDKMIVRTAKIDEHAGFVPGVLDFIEDSYNIEDAYIAPNLRNANELEIATCSGNLQMPNSEKRWLGPSNTYAYSRNLDKIQFHKYGDVIEGNITTNLNGVKLMNTSDNDFTKDTTVSYRNMEDDVVYQTEWAYPSANRPYLSRKSNLDPYLHQVDAPKEKFKPLQHHFFTMPPILKPNGALLGQRASFTLEQHVSVTFNQIQSVFDSEEDIDTDLYMNQASGVKLRRNIYGRVIKTDDLRNPLCGRNDPECVGSCRVPPTWDGVNKFFGDIPRSDFDQIFSITNYQVTEGDLLPFQTIDYVTIANIEAKTLILEQWINNCNNTSKIMQLRVQNPTALPGSDPKAFRYGVFEGINQQHYLDYVAKPDGSAWQCFVQINFGGFQSVLNKYGVLCQGPSRNDVQHTNYKTVNKFTSVFFT